MSGQGFPAPAQRAAAPRGRRGRGSLRQGRSRTRIFAPFFSPRLQTLHRWPRQAIGHLSRMMRHNAQLSRTVPRTNAGGRWSGGLRMVRDYVHSTTPGRNGASAAATAWRWASSRVTSRRVSHPMVPTISTSSRAERSRTTSPRARPWRGRSATPRGGGLLFAPIFYPNTQGAPGLLQGAARPPQRSLDRLLSRGGGGADAGVHGKRNDLGVRKGLSENCGGGGALRRVLGADGDAPRGGGRRAAAARGHLLD